MLAHKEVMQAAKAVGKAVIGLSVVAVLTLQSALAQDSLVKVYETRISVPEISEVLGVDEVIFRWTTDESSGVIGVGSGVTNLEMKVDDSNPDTGDVFIDTLVIDDVVQPLITGDGETPVITPRSAADVVWEFDLDTLQVLSFRNLVTATGSEGTVYMVEGSGGGSTYEVVKYPTGTSNANKAWALARAAAQAAGGDLAVIDTEIEDLLIHDLVVAKLGTTGAMEAWVGGYQAEDGAEPGEGWMWVDGSLIPLSTSIGNYQNWDEDEPNNDPNGTLGYEDHLVVNANGIFAWNDEGYLPKVGGYVIQFMTGGVSITRFIDGEADPEEPATESVLRQRTAIVSPFTVRNLFVPEGQGTIYDIDSIEQEGNVVTPGLINVDVCLAPDPREPFVINGGGKPPKGNGQANGATNNDKEGGTGVYNQDILPLSALKGRGTCTGNLPFTTDDDEYQTWEELLDDIDLVLPKTYRGFFGEVTFTPPGGTERTAKAVWLTVVVVRSLGIEFDGPVSSVIFPELGVDYDNTPAGEIPACENELNYRSISVGGLSEAIDGLPINVEGSAPILQTVQCNRDWGMTRRSVHVSPIRYTASGPATKVGKEYVQTQLTGIQGTLNEAALCSNNAVLADALQDSLDEASLALANGNYPGVIANLEELAHIANTDDDYSDPDSLETGFNACGFGPNYPGNLIARSLSAAFTTWDRLLPANQDPETWEIYPIPCEFVDLVPDLREGTEPVCSGPLP